MEMLLLLYLETVLVSTLCSIAAIFKMVKQIYNKRYKIIYRDKETCKENIKNSKVLRNFLIPGYNLFFGVMSLFVAYDKKITDEIFDELKAEGSISKMTPKEYTRYLNYPNIFTSFRIARDYNNRLEKTHKIKVKNGVIYFDIKDNNINVIKSVGKVSELSEEEQIELIYENELFYKDIYKLGELEYIKGNVKDRLFLKEMKSNVSIHESKLKNTRLEKINDTKNMLKKMKNDILLLELDISNRENKNSKKLVKKQN